MTKKILSALLVLMLCFTFAACSRGYKLEKIDLPSPDTVHAQGGNMAIIGDYMYFVNGVGASTGDNAYGKPVAGAIMRVKLSEIEKDEPVYEMVCPKILFNSNTKSTGLYINGGRIYFTSPSVKRDNSNAVMNDRLDIISCKLDGSDVKTHFTTDVLGSSATYFMTQNGKVYLCYLLETTVYSVDLGASKPQAKEIAEDVTNAVAGDNIIFYTLKKTFKDSTGNDAEQPYNEIWAVTPDGTKDSKAIASGDRSTSTDETEAYDQNILNGVTYSIAAYSNNLLLIGAAQNNNASTLMFVYDASSKTGVNDNQLVSRSVLSSVIPYIYTKGSVNLRGFLFFDDSYVKFIYSDGTGIAKSLNLMYGAGVTLLEVKGGDLFYTVSGVLFKQNLGGLVEAALDVKPIYQHDADTALCTTGMHSSVKVFFIYNNALYFINSSGFAMKATVEDEAVTETYIRYEEL